MEESLNVHAISEQIIGEVPAEMNWVYGISDLFILSSLVVALVSILLLPLQFFKR